MSRGEVLEWIEGGQVAPERQVAVLRAAGILPTPADWRAFLSQLTLWLGTAALAAAVIFFFAFNWDELGRIAKFALVEGAIVLVLVACWRIDLDGLAGKAVLVLLSLLTGALLALTGQIYQTGADTWELFAWWAVLIVPWVLVSRFTPLWLIWLVLLNAAASLYFDDMLGGWAQMWTQLAINSLALILWEAGHKAGLAWLRDSWPPRLVAIFSGYFATALVISAIVDSANPQALPGALAYAAWLGAFYYWYRRVRPDAFMLAGGVLSFIAAVTVFLSDLMIESGNAGAFLLIGLVVIGMSAGGAMWLRSVVREARA